MAPPDDAACLVPCMSVYVCTFFLFCRCLYVGLFCVLYLFVFSFYVGLFCVVCA